MDSYKISEKGYTMILENITPVPGKFLVQPTSENSSSFSTETKKYDRKAIGIIKNADGGMMNRYIGRTVVYDDSHSVDFSIDGVALSIINESDVVAYIKGDD